MKILKLVLLALGVWLLVATLRSVGLEDLAARLRGSSPWLLAAGFAAYPAIYALNGLGWRHSFPSGLPRSVPFRDVFLIRVIGETLNASVPWAGQLGGEPVKAHLLKVRHGVPMATSFASLLIVHTTLYASLNTFVLAALVLTRWSRPIDPRLFGAAFAFLAVLGGAAALLFAGLHWGVFEKLHGLGRRFPFLRASDEAAERFARLDADIRAFYRGNRRDFWLSTGYNFAALAAGTIEVYFFAAALGAPVSWVEAWVIEAMIQAVRIATFFIPSSVGAQESGIVAVFTGFGIAAPTGLAFAVLRRVRELVWIAFGLALYAFWKVEKPAGAG